MKKLIALILILVITSFVVVSKDSTPLGIKIAIENNKNPNPKNRNWEYVKQEIADEKIDLELDYSQKHQEPILLDIKNATFKDSLAVVAFIKNLKKIFPLKKVGYFSDFVGKDFEAYKKNGKALKPIKQSFDVVISYTIQLSFDPKIQYTSSGTSTYDGSNLYPFPIGALRENVWNLYNSSIQLIFGFNDEVTVEKRRAFIAAEFFRIYWKSYFKNFVATEAKYPTLRQDQKEEVKYSENNPSSTTNIKNIGFIKDDTFLITKLFAMDFKKQFETYMYASYPWHYASSFINKKMHEFKVWGIIIGVGGLAFILIFSYFQDRNYNYSYLNYLFPIFLILLHFINLTNIYQYLTKFNSVIGWKSHILFQIPLAIVLSVLISFVLWGLEKISLKENQNFSYQLVLKVCYTFITFILPMVIIAILNWGQKGMLESLFPYVFFVLGLAIGRGLLLYLNHFSESLVKEKDVELSRLQEAKAEAEVKMLQSQINPHFLYNALNSIASLAHTDADKTEKMALSLSDLFRHSINRKGKKVNTLGDELSLVRNYLEIEQIRFGDRLKFSIDVDPDLLAIEIPMFMLQPLVENAIKHGISKIEGQGEIVLEVNKKDNGILISVQDNGPDFPEGLVSGHGLQTVYDLLRFSYGDKAEISSHNQPQKEITIFIDAVFK
jgi:two-component system LytT family sensor kinase